MKSLHLRTLQSYIWSFHTMQVKFGLLYAFAVEFFQYDLNNNYNAHVDSVRY